MKRLIYNINKSTKLLHGLIVWLIKWISIKDMIRIIEIIDMIKTIEIIDRLNKNKNKT